MVDLSMTVPSHLNREKILADCRTACVQSEEIVRASTSLSAVAAVASPGEDNPVSLRRIVVHMIEETGRHADHADILREQIDGAPT